MQIRELQIINFRNLRFVRANFAPGLNVIHGSNAQGKTNLLEAVYMLVTGRSFRTSMEREIVPWVREEYEATLIRACVEKRGMEERFLFSFNQAEKHLFVNGNAIPRLGELIGRLNAVLFTPSDLQLVRGSPGMRRRFLDMEISQLSRTYLVHLQRYDLALRQRNALLKQHQRRPNLAQELAPWDEQLAEHGAEIVYFRADILRQLSALAAEVYQKIADRSEALQIVYHPSLGIGVEDTVMSIRERLYALLQSNVDTDTRRQQTSSGPHRDDFAFLIQGRDARDFGSQGQQRSCVLALRLAELPLMEHVTGHTPLLLLDDLVSELDRSRKDAFFKALEPRYQTFLTVTERDLITSQVAPERVFRMEDGILEVDDAQ